MLDATFALGSEAGRREVQLEHALESLAAVGAAMGLAMCVCGQGGLRQGWSAVWRCLAKLLM